jgi:hypothetical protein
MNNIDDYDNDDSGNNSRGIVAGVNRIPSFFRTLANPSFSLTKFVSKFALKYSFATIRFLKWKLNKLKLKIEERNLIPMMLWYCGICKHGVCCHQKKRLTQKI